LKPLFNPMRLDFFGIVKILKALFRRPGFVLVYANIGAHKLFFRLLWKRLPRFIENRNRFGNGLLGFVI
jgi:hypothetical protein